MHLEGSNVKICSPQIKFHDLDKTQPSELIAESIQLEGPNLQKVTLQKTHLTPHPQNLTKKKQLYKFCSSKKERERKLSRFFSIFFFQITSFVLLIDFENIFEKYLYNFFCETFEQPFFSFKYIFSSLYFVFFYIYIFFSTIKVHFLKKVF